MKRLALTLIVAFLTSVAFSQGPIKTNIKPINLPRCMPEWAKKNLTGYNPDKAMKIDDTKAGKKLTFYYVLYLKNAERIWVKYSADCTSATKVSQAEVDPFLKLEPPAPKKDPSQTDPPAKP